MHGLRFSTVPDLSHCGETEVERVSVFQNWPCGRHASVNARSYCYCPARATASPSAQPTPVGLGSDAASLTDSLLILFVLYTLRYTQVSFSASSTVPRPDFPISPDYKEPTFLFLFLFLLHFHFSSPHSIRFTYIATCLPDLHLIHTLMHLGKSPKFQTIVIPPRAPLQANSNRIR